MSAPKNILAVALFGKTEASYSSSLACTGSTDTVEYCERPIFAASYANAGERAFNEGTAGTKARVVPTARTFATAIKLEAKGPATTMTATVVPPGGLHALMLASGYSASLISGDWIYAQQVPDSPFSSVQFEVYQEGKLYKACAAYSDMKFSLDKAVNGFFTFDVKGLIGLPTSVARANTNYAYQSVLPPVGVSVGLSIGSFTTAIVRKIDFALGRTIDPREDLNSANGHSGFSPGRRKTVLNITIEQVDIATFNPYADLAAATPKVVSFVLGQVNNNNITFSGSFATLADVKEGNESNNVSTWDLVYDLPDSPTLNDGHSWKWS